MKQILELPRPNYMSKKGKCSQNSGFHLTPELGNWKLDFPGVIATLEGIRIRFHFQK